MKDEKLRKFRAKEELKIKLIKTINEFTSKEEPDIILTNKDIIFVLSSIIVRTTE